mmetsp:Transcript_58403/g.126847  ORF Transcript_58403/g.126847 Transcript_58403/m.126847 type:complete len:387 (+) Transcript_58403:94-1254(+)
MRVAWLSVDPVRPMVNFYPKTMAIRLEAALKANAGKCELGADFYNATVHFYTSDGMVQTTKAQGMGRHGYKPPGYRSVRRVEIFEESDRALKIFSRRKGYEWRIVNTEAEAEHAFQETVPEEVLISADALPVESLELQAWSGDDLVASGSAAADKPVVIWQWCRGTEEEHGDSLLHLSDHMWCPYTQENNSIIESAFKRNEVDVEIALQDRKLKIIFTAGSTFALQYYVAARKERVVRRVIKTVQELREMHERMIAQESQIAGEQQAVEYSGQEPVPHAFLCPITQASESLPTSSPSRLSAHLRPPLYASSDTLLRVSPHRSRPFPVASSASPLPERALRWLCRARAVVCVRTRRTSCLTPCALTTTSPTSAPRSSAGSKRTKPRR